MESQVRGSLTEFFPRRDRPVPIIWGDLFDPNGKFLFLLFPIGSMYAIYGNIYHQYTPFMLAYIPYMDPMGFIVVECGNPTVNSLLTIA